MNNEAWNGKIGQVINVWKHISFFTQKRCQTWHRLFIGETTRCHVWHRFLTPCLASKSCCVSMLWSLARNFEIASFYWSLKCRSWAIDYGYKVCKLFEAKNAFKKRCQTWHRVVLTRNNTMPCLASCFDAMSGVKKLPNFMQSINCPTSRLQASIDPPSVCRWSYRRNTWRETYYSR